MEALDALGRSLDLGQGERSTLEALARRVTPLRFPSGEVVFREDDECGPAYLIEDGEIRLTALRPDGNPQFLADLGPGRLVGEMTSLIGRRRSATGIAVTDVSAWEVDPEALREALESDSKLAFNLLISLMELMVEQDVEAVTKAGRTTQQQLASVILDLDRRRAPQGRVIDVSDGDLAIMTGMTPMAVTMTLGTFRRSGAIDREAGGLVVVDANRLGWLAGARRSP
jgi:CRP/FNR family transcriptional regulator, cyclic AMP receptor protein